MIEQIKARLVEDWRSMLGWWSIRWAALGTVVLPIMTIVPSLPDEVQALLPPAVRVAVTGIWSLLYIAFRVTAQRKPDA